MINEPKIPPVFLVAGGVLLGVFAFRKVIFGNPFAAPEAHTNLDGSGSPQDWAKIQADRLHAAMNRVGTDEPTIYQVFSEIDTDQKFAAVNNAFGVRPYENWVGGLPSWMYVQCNLIQWLHTELRASEIAYVNEILQSNNITYSV